MQIKVDITGLKELQASLKDFSERRMSAAIAAGLTRTAKAVSGDWQADVNKSIDRPNARTSKAVAFTGANAANLQAAVFLKDRMSGTAPADYLAPQEFGGNRLLKKFEQALINSGAMPSGYLTVPGKHAKLDGNGNVSRGQLIAVIRALGAQYSPGYQQTISKSADKRLAAQAKHGRQYIAVSPQEATRFRVSAGIYERMPSGSRKAIFLFKNSVSYKRRLSLMGRANVQEVQTMARAQIDRAINESLVRLAARGAVK